MPSHLFVVSGCGRSGTGYTSTVLTALGAPCGHESIFNPLTFHKPGTVVWPERYAGDASWLAAPVLGKLPERSFVMHQVRNPLEVIRSFLRIQFFTQPSTYRDFAEAHVPELRQGGPTIRAMRYWVEWNRMVEAAADYEDLQYRRHRLEDLDLEGILGLCKFLGVERSPETVQRILASHRRDYNTRGDKRHDSDVTWETLPKGSLLDELVEMARDYGYEPGSVPQMQAG